MNVVIGMAMGTACITPALEAATGPGVPALLTSAELMEAGEAVITLVAVVEPEAAGAEAVASFPAQLLEMMVAMAGPGRMGLWPPVYSGFS